MGAQRHGDGLCHCLQPGSECRSVPFVACLGATGRNGSLTWDALRGSYEGPRAARMSCRLCWPFSPRLLAGLCAQEHLAGTETRQKHEQPEQPWRPQRPRWTRLRHREAGKDGHTIHSSETAAKSNHEHQQQPAAAIPKHSPKHPSRNHTRKSAVAHSGAKHGRSDSEKARLTTSSMLESYDLCGFLLRGQSCEADLTRREVRSKGHRLILPRDICHLVLSSCQRTWRFPQRERQSSFTHSGTQSEPLPSLFCGSSDVPSSFFRAMQFQDKHHVQCLGKLVAEPRPCVVAASFIVSHLDKASMVSFGVNWLMVVSPSCDLLAAAVQHCPSVVARRLPGIVSPANQENSRFLETDRSDVRDRACQLSASGQPQEAAPVASCRDLSRQRCCKAAAGVDHRMPPTRLQDSHGSN